MADADGIEIALLELLWPVDVGLLQAPNLNHNMHHSSSSLHAASAIRCGLVHWRVKTCL